MKRIMYFVVCVQIYRHLVMSQLVLPCLLPLSKTTSIQRPLFLAQAWPLNTGTVLPCTIVYTPLLPLSSTRSFNFPPQIFSQAFLKKLCIIIMMVLNYEVLVQMICLTTEHQSSDKQQYCEVPSERPDIQKA